MDTEISTGKKLGDELNALNQSAFERGRLLMEEMEQEKREGIKMSAGEELAQSLIRKIPVMLKKAALDGLTSQQIYYGQSFYPKGDFEKDCEAALQRFCRKEGLNLEVSFLPGPCCSSDKHDTIYTYTIQISWGREAGGRQQVPQKEKVK